MEKNRSPATGPGLIWHVAPAPVSYPDALAGMESHVDAMLSGTSEERVWLLEHPPLYTAGTSADPADLITPTRLPVFRSGRGGQFTYHGPGQRVVYLMLDLNKRGRDVRRLVTQIETWMTEALSQLGVIAHTRCDRPGLWVKRPEKGPDAEDKIAAIGIRVRRWMTFHGVSLNVCPDLSHYGGIVPCGISDQGVTSLHDLGRKYSMAEADKALAATFPNHFGPTLG